MPRRAAAARPLAPADFDRLMAPLGPFEAAPHLAVAVSGGLDSMALALLAHAWARARGGEAIGLTVDHGLRPESAAEAQAVARWLEARGVRHHILYWRGQKPQVNLQAAARAARYRLLESWCRGAGILHLLLAHQLEDQAETFLLRLGRGSGVDGLAAMAACVETPWARLLRPLLAVPRARLGATLEAVGQGWVEDPSNRDPRHARVRLRTLLPSLAREGLDVPRLAATAGRLGRARQALEAWTARLLAEAGTLDPAGYALVARGSLAAAPAEVGLRALARLLRCVGGGAYGPRLERLERLYRELVDEGLPKARTLGGCRILRLRRRTAERILVCREAAAIAAEMPALPDATAEWDGRFALAFAPRFPQARGPVRVGALGIAGWAEVVQRAPDLRASLIPVPVRPSLPALRDLEGVLAVPHLSYGRDGSETGTVYVRHLAFRPQWPLATGLVMVA